MNSIVDKIDKNSIKVIEDNNFLFAAFQNRLITRLVRIFEKYKIPMNKTMLNKNIEENLLNSLISINEEVIEKYVILISNYEKIIVNHVNNHTDTDTIKKSTMSFVDKVKNKNKTFVTSKIANNFIEYIKSITYVYDSNELNKEILNRINIDINEIIGEFNRNNYNFVIESINEVIKNIINNM